MNKIYFNPTMLKKMLLSAILLFIFKISFSQCVPSGMVDYNNFNITNVQVLGDLTSQINNNTGANNATYTDFSSQSVNVTAGSTYNVTISHVKENWGNLKVVMWIDYMGDGSYVEVYDSGGYVNNNNNTAITNASFLVNNTALPGTAILRIGASYCNNCGEGATINADSCTFTGRGEVEDYTLNISQISSTPVASDDNLDVLINSTAGIDNQINVAINDFAGTAGGDGEDYSLLTGATNGIVTEISDGVFQYVPNSDFVGVDSFTYNLCDINGDCAMATVNISLGFGACAPTSNSNGTHFITNVLLVGDTSTINNSSGDDGGYGNYISVPSADLTRGSTYPIELSVSNIMAAENRSGWTVYIDLNKDGNITLAEEVWSSELANPIPSGEDHSLSNTNNTFDPGSITIPTTVGLGKTLMRIGARRYWHSDDPCGTTSGLPEEFEDYIVDIKNNAISQDIDVYGNGINIISGSTITDTDNNTNFNIYDINSGAITRTFIITNVGVSDLTLLTPFVTVTGSAAFSVSSLPAITTLAPNVSTTFTIAFDPTTIATFSATVTINSNDPDENPYTYTIEGEGAETFPDTDGDSVPNNIDVDDDNDGLTDAFESLTCASYPNAPTTDVVFLNETFGAGTNRTQINGNYVGVTTTYCYEDGTGSCPATYNPDSVNDGDYTVHYIVTNNNNIADGIDVDISQWAEDYWYAGEDHTTGDINGRMAIFNATENPGVFYSQNITGTTPNVPIEFGFFAINIDRTDAPGLSGREKPEVIIRIYDPNGIEIASATSGLINATSPVGDWVEVSASFTTTYTQFTVELSNASPGGEGSDLAIDDIIVKQILCDLDGDGVADVVDLDNDNDGIPNVVELGLIDDNLDATVFNDTNNPWIDTNGNGLHDAYKTLIVLDSDGDGTPDYLDLDSDNDSIFDSLEYDSFGDLDVNGDGLGDGSDYQDTIVNNTTDNQDGDGILPPIDNNDNDVDGPLDTDHGTFSYSLPIDTDGDGIPNYLDTDSNDPTNNPANGTDISETIYSDLDGNNDGIIDGNIDTDLDGILDAFDTDNNSYGSPRDLDDSYSLLFDGRNDYVEDSNVIGSGSTTVMGFIKSEGANTTNSTQVVAGQDNFYILLNNTGDRVSVVLNGSTIINSSTAIPNNMWVHLAATTTSGKTILYINGEYQGESTSGSVAADVSNFTIGRRANLDASYFKGEIEEVRVFNKALTEEELQRMVYQELDDTNNFDSGLIIPKDISPALGTSLVKYYKMDAFKDDIADNKVTATIDQGTGAKLYNIKDVYFQTAPLPYETTTDGDWSTTATWLHGDVWDITDEVNNKDWSIVDIKNNVNTAVNHTTLGLFVEPSQELEIADNELRNTWYLKLDGFIDLENESQLIQTNESELINGANGKLERDQQGTENLYTYNYFSSPVYSNNPNALVDGDETYTVGNVMMDGTNVANPVAINFISAHNGNNSTTPIQTSSNWIYKFGNLGSNYYNWEHVMHTGTLKVGEGYSMKGPGAGAISNEQNYVFSGKPNNGIITLPIDAGNDYLVGNPYASAIDADAFILDNTHLSGTLYFWEHFGGGTHVTAGYKGGYATYNLSGGIPAIQHEYSTGGIDASGGTGVKTPRRYIPVSQGFFVEGISTGNIKFENDQRIFVKETGNTNSWFFKGSNNNTQDSAIEDLRPKFRFGFKSPETFNRQILLTIDENATIDYDWGYDAKINEGNSEDMYWEFANEKFLIQGTNEIIETTTLPLTVKTENGGIIEIDIISLENVDASLDIYLKDNDVYHNLRESEYITTVASGEITNRFEIVFTPNPNTLSNEGFQENNNLNLFVKDNSVLTISNPSSIEINNIQVINMLGQIVFEKQVDSSNNKIEIPLQLQTGTYIFNINSNSFTIVKKAIINP